MFQNQNDGATLTNFWFKMWNSETLFADGHEDQTKTNRTAVLDLTLS